MDIISTPASDISVGDVLDINESLHWLRKHPGETIALATPLACVRENVADISEGPLDELAVALDIALFNFAHVTGIETGTHSGTGGAVVAIRNSIYDLVLPASFCLPRITNT